MAPVAPRSAAVTGRPAREAPTTIESSRWRRSARLEASAKDRHDLRGRRDHKAGLAIGAFAARLVLLTGAHDHTPQRAIVHIHRARPRDLRRIEVQRIAEEKMRVHHRRQQIVRSRDGVKIAVKMQIDLLARLHLRQAAARCAALHARRPAPATARAK